MIHTVTIQLLECPTEDGIKVWGGTVIDVDPLKPGSNRRVLTVWGKAGADQFQAKLLSSNQKFPADLLADKKAEKDQKGYQPMSHGSDTLSVEFATNSDRGVAWIDDVVDIDDVGNVSASVPMHSWIIRRRDGKSLTISQDVAEKFIQEKAALSHNLLTNTPTKHLLFQKGDDRIVLCDDVVRTPNGISLAGDTKQPLAGTGMFREWQTMLFIEYLVRQLNAFLVEEVFVAELTINGEASIQLKDWKTIEATAGVVNLDLNVSVVRVLAEQLELVKPKFDVASAVSSSSVETFF